MLVRVCVVLIPVCSMLGYLLLPPIFIDEFFYSLQVRMVIFLC